MKRALCILLGMLALACSAQPRLAERALADVARIAVPSGLKAESYLGIESERMQRASYQFTATNFSFFPGGPTRYKQFMVVSVMAADASDADYASLPRGMNMLYETRSRRQPQALGSGVLTMTDATYYIDDAYRPAVEYLYTDKVRRLQIAWHALRKVVDVDEATAVIGGMAASFRLLRDPVAAFTEARAMPAQQAQAAARKVTTAQAMLQREGYAALVPGKPVLRNGVYLEWMATPEARYQLLLPLGRVRAAAAGSVVSRPRPMKGASGIGWREFSAGSWVFDNDPRANLPMDGIAAALAAQQQDPGFVYFYFAATVRVEEEDDDRRLSSLDWFFKDIPETQRRWRQGLLVGPGVPEAD